MIKLLDLLNKKGRSLSPKTKLIRHISSTYDLYRIYINDEIEYYQTVQSKPVFKDCDQFISFIGLERSKSQFIGVYNVLGVKYNPNFTWKKNSLLKNLDPGKYIYKLERDKRFDDLIGRLIIDWGKSTRSWHQWLRDKEVIEILPKGYVRHFPGYLDFVLDFTELKKIIENPDSNREWEQKLGAVGGIYLITDSKTGKQYVGSAYGNKGIWGRWMVYSKTGHGGNIQLKKLLKNKKSYFKSFRFTILRTLPKTLTSREVIEYEVIYKDKLGSKAFGLNSN